MKKMINTKQLAEHFGVSEMTIFRWRKNGMPYKNLNYNMCRYNLDLVEKWLEERGQITK